jgi:hypothetical protein
MHLHTAAQTNEPIKYCSSSKIITGQRAALATICAYHQHRLNGVKMYSEMPQHDNENNIAAAV